MKYKKMISLGMIVIIILLISLVGLIVFLSVRSEPLLSPSKYTKSLSSDIGVEKPTDSATKSSSNSVREDLCAACLETRHMMGSTCDAEWGVCYEDCNLNYPYNKKQEIYPPGYYECIDECSVIRINCDMEAFDWLQSCWTRLYCSPEY